MRPPSSNSGDVRTQRLEGVDQVGVVRGGVDFPVEAANQAVVVVDLLVDHVGVEQGVVPRPELTGIPREDVRICVTCGELGSLSLKTGPHLEERIDIAVGDVGDDEATPLPVV